MRFTKLQALGNDFICLDATASPLPEDLPALARAMTHRRLGAGGDGLLCVLPGDGRGLRMVLYNADGSRAAMCGNGLRCLAVYAWAEGLADPALPLTVETDAGRRTLTAVPGGVRADMGRPVLSPPMELEAGGDRLQLWPVSMGNPHAVLFTGAPEKAPLERLGPALEGHPAFPGGVNVEVVEVLAPDRLRLRVWERGCGETPACGTGACAAFAAAVRTGRAARRGRVELPGGVLALSWPEEDGPIALEGPAAIVFAGEWPG